VKSERTSGDPLMPDLDFPLPPELTELVSKATQREIRSEVLQIHAKLLGHDPEFKDCVDNGKHLQALFDILASKLVDRADFDRLAKVSIPAMVAAIKNELGWTWPSGDSEALKHFFLLGSILNWRLNSQATKAKAPAAPNRANLKRDPGLQQLKSRVRELRDEKLSHRQICDRLGDAARPSRATWRDLTWPTAYKRYSSAVARWLSDACH
jgi:hypothetical protein